MSIPLKVFCYRLAFERKGVFRDIRIKTNLDLTNVVSEYRVKGKWLRALGTNFVDESDFRKRTQMVFLEWEVCSTV